MSLEEPSIHTRQVDADPFAPVVQNRAELAVSSPFKVVAFNARGCTEPELVARLMRQPPLSGAAIIMLSEADWGLRRSRGRQTARELAQLLEMSFAFGPEFAFRRQDNRFTSFFGNAILSAVPLDHVRVVQLPMYFDYTNRTNWKLAPGAVRLARRAAISVEIKIGGRRLTVALAHLENRTQPEGRARQMAQFVAGLPKSGPALIGGDFNTTSIDVRTWRNCAVLAARLILEPYRLRRPQRREPLFEILERAGFDFRDANVPLAPTFTPTGLLPRFLRAKLDWLGLRKLKPVPGSARVVPARLNLRRISDHDAVMCELTL